MEPKIMTKAKEAAAPYIELLKKDGYCVIPQVYSEEQVSRALELTRRKFDESVSSQSDRMPYLNKDQPMVYNLQSKDPYYLELLFYPEILHEILKYFLNDQWFKSVPEGDPNYILRSYLARSSNYQMPMHIDSFIPYSGKYCFIMQCAMVLEDQEEHNGCTAIVPGSHHSPDYTTQDAFEQAKPIITKAGDLALWDSRVWHGAYANESGGTRWSIIATFCRWWIKQAFDIPGNLPQEIYDGLTDWKKGVLGYCSVPYDNEACGIDMKRNYDLLPERVEDYRS